MSVKIQCHLYDLPAEFRYPSILPPFYFTAPVRAPSPKVLVIHRSIRYVTPGPTESDDPQGKQTQASKKSRTVPVLHGEIRYRVICREMQRFGETLGTDP